MEEKGKVKKAKKPRGRAKYNDIYTRNMTGEYEYSGEYYRYDEPEKRMRIIKALYIGLSMMSSVLLVCAGLFNNDGTRMPYIVLPYAACYLPAIFAMMCSVQIAARKTNYNYTRKQYDKIIMRFLQSSVAMLALMSIAVVGDAIFFAAFSSPENAKREIPFILLCAGTLLLDIFLVIVQRKTKMRQIAR